MKEEVDVLGSPSLTVRTVSVEVKQHWTNERKCTFAVLRETNVCHQLHAGSVQSFIYHC